MDGSPRTSSPNLSFRQILRPGTFWNKATGLVSEFRFFPDSTPAPNLGRRVARGGWLQNFPSGVFCGVFPGMVCLEHFLTGNSCFQG